jgi:hypothetical protein
VLQKKLDETLGKLDIEKNKKKTDLYGEWFNNRGKLCIGIYTC